MKFQIGYIDGEDRNGHSCFIHKNGCRDFKEAEFVEYYSFDGTLEEAIASYLDEDMTEMGWDESIVKVFPCTRMQDPVNHLV